MSLTPEQQHSRMTEAPLFPLLVSMSVPTVASQLVTVVYNTADTWFVSQIGTSASAAVGVSFALMSLIQAVGVGFGMGAGSLVSLSLGAKENENAHVYASSAFVGAIAAGILIGIIGLIFLEPLMRMLGSTETMLPYSCAYAKYILLAAPVLCSTFVLNIVLRAEGHAVFAMAGICSGVLLNLVLDPLFIFVLDYGIAGAAIATAIGQVCSLIVLSYNYITGKSIVKISFKNISRRISTYGEILSIGAPTVFRQGLGSLSTAILNSLASGYGDAAVAAVTIVNRLYFLVRHIIVGLGQGFQPVAGYNYGAGKKLRTKMAFIYSCIIGTVICIVAACSLWLNGESIIRWFRDDAEVIRIGTEALTFSVAVMPLMAYSTYVNMLYQSLGFKVGASILASCRQGIMFLPLAAILPYFLGLQGVEMIQPGADLLTFFISVPFQIYFFRNYLSLEHLQEPS